MTKQTAAAFSFVSLDRDSPVPLYHQLYSELREAILSGRLAAGERLPSTRALASDLGVSRNTAVTAFDQLLAEGYIDGRTGSGTYVARDLPEACLAVRREAEDERAAPPERPSLSRRGDALVAIGDSIASTPLAGLAFRAASPALDLFPYDVWMRLVARRRAMAPGERLGYGETEGYGPLREAIADYLRTARGVRCDAEQVIVVSGSQDGMDLLARMLLDVGDRVWLEEPGYPGARSALFGAGAEIVPVPVDAEGLDVAEGSRLAPDARMAYVTPSHQYPLGMTMSLGRRLALLDWANRAGAWILEDDYDSEYRYSGRPLASLQGLDTNARVIYLGTFSKVLFPSLRLAYVVVPPGMVEAISYARIASTPPTFEQMVLADFITEGHFVRHVRRMRARYGRRQAALLAEAARMPEGFPPLEPADAGMHLLARLPDDVSDQEVARAAAERGVSVQPLSVLYAREPVRQGLLLGYACVDVRAMRDGLERLDAAIRAVAGAGGVGE